ncbi:hypothetical protein [Marinobacter salsuginis]|uniref:hypothetical protein n=1 Tax=Marinobacter salsuginis TaxID=418719 RepID=UPI0010AB3BC2|nr:hypothetical protein [Marinobacter salsuginis]
MASRKKWYVRFIAGNPEIFSDVKTEPRSPMMRSEALEAIGHIDNNGWRGWVEDESGNRIYETATEKRYTS